MIQCPSFLVTFLCHSTGAEWSWHSSFPGVADFCKPPHVQGFPRSVCDCSSWLNQLNRCLLQRQRLWIFPSVWAAIFRSLGISNITYIVVGISQKPWFRQCLSPAICLPEPREPLWKSRDLSRKNKYSKARLYESLLIHVCINVWKLLIRLPLYIVHCDKE